MSAIRNVCLLIGILPLAGLAGCGKNGSSATPTASIAADAPRKEEFDDRHPAVLVRTSLGEFTVELEAEKSPISVDNFLSYVNRGYYDGTLVHMVDSGYLALAGGYNRDRRPLTPDFPIRNEAHNGLKNLKGTLTLARPADEIDAAAAQFYINLADNPNLDHRDRTPTGYGYAVFGRITQGVAILDQLNSVAVTDEPDFPKLPTNPVVIESIRRIK